MINLIYFWDQNQKNLKKTFELSMKFFHKDEIRYIPVEFEYKSNSN